LREALEPFFASRFFSVIGLPGFSFSASAAAPEGGPTAENWPTHGAGDDFHVHVRHRSSLLASIQESPSEFGKRTKRPATDFAPLTLALARCGAFADALHWPFGPSEACFRKAKLFLEPVVTGPQRERVA
jgi:hypothetical protein